MEIVFIAPDQATIASEAARLGFIDSAGNIVTNGVFETGGGWFLNLVGDAYDTTLDPPVRQDGYCGRLRINGQPESFPTFSSEIVQYYYRDDLGGWSSDMTTLAPAWVGQIGMIA